MLKRLAEAHPHGVVQLKKQYRMHSDINKLASHAIYDGAMECAALDRILSLPGFPQIRGQGTTWLTNVLDPNKAVVFVDTDGIKRSPTSPIKQNPSSESNTGNNIVPLERTASRQKGGNMINEVEAILVRKITKALAETGLPPSSMAVICPFRAQIKILNDNPEMIKLRQDGLEISTIDKFQGRDKEA